MGELADITRSRVPAGLTWPEPLDALCRWIDEHGVTGVDHAGELYGSLAPSWSRGTEIAVQGMTAEATRAFLQAWFGTVPDLPLVWPFCRTGSDGSHTALWDDGGDTRIVHLGSGSGSLLTCVLADDAVDLLRLLAVGYDELCWNDQWGAPPQADPGSDWTPVNQPFRDWVTTTFDVSIPTTGLEVVPAPAEMGDEDTTDPWCRLVDRLTDQVTDPG